ncbi:MAG: hypothetical protein KC482_16510 [Dehalococcoidia bacterium]|nr:hypothetical protein [Dehalococcoidia bacterium]MCA9846213.1 hypothetical protein [Dehalococcoidia bacterium]MCA9855157.1 hypothetical protein [Dehalococcoidia bacterium]
MSRKIATIIAYVGEDGRYQPVSDRAAVAARASHARLILHNIDAVGIHIPFPVRWSTPGEQDMFDSGRLTAEMLRDLGRIELARQVAVLSSSGVETYGWLPETSILGALLRYAAARSAHTTAECR